MLVKPFKRNQRGDTIIEVMIVLAVLGLAIGLSYTIANRSLQNLRQAQENSRATELARSQIETIRYFSQIPSPDASKNVFLAAAVTYCIDTQAQTVVQNPADLPDNNPCNVDALYKVRVVHLPGDVFQITVKWEDVRGDVEDSVTTYYKVHQS